MDEIKLTGYTPGALGRITELHGDYYARHWDLGLYFEAKVATELAAFMNRFDAARDGAWFAHVDGRIAGAVFIDGARAADEGARLRWFILDEAYQGLGLGNRLMDAAMDFCREQRFRRVYLTTFAGLTAARHLYEKHGFRLCDEIDGTELTGNPALTEQVFEWVMGDV
ncbi:MAG: GNAT family N-acetyltransferase [Anaerolineae bacterium]|nr:GNAT family N-acetyltransferase [Anaerolineae bacterium]